MDDILKQLSDIESSAVNIIDEANAQKKVLAQQFSIDIKSMEEEIALQTQTTIKQMQDNTKEEIEKKLMEQEKLSKKQISSINRNYEENHIQYVDRLFSEITKE